MVIIKSVHSTIIAAIIFCVSQNAAAQMITGTWHGKINRQKVEVKIIQSGDSLTGTSYYYESANNYRRYSIKGYFDQQTNSAVWWDDRLIEERSGKMSLSSLGKIAMLSRADFNCSGGGVMKLDGDAAIKENETPKGEVHLDKTTNTIFNDEWDFVIDNYTTGANDPDIIDSVSALAFENTPVEEPVVIQEKPKPVPQKQQEVIVKKEPVVTPASQEKTIAAPVIPLTIDQKFTTREKVINKEIEISADSIELRFYDNAEVDGDSISLFLNNKLIFQHIRLTGNAYIIKLATAELQQSNDLVMVAENLGAIPPNTSYMVVMDGDKKHEAILASTENSSALIRLIKKK